MAKCKDCGAVFHVFAPHTCQSVETCAWTESGGMDHGEYWETSCGQTWSFIDGTPQENHVRFCHWCGKPAVFIAQCDRCFGSGTYEIGGNDIDSDPPSEMTCEVCAGAGKVVQRTAVRV